MVEQIGFDKQASLQEWKSLLLQHTPPNGGHLKEIVYKSEVLTQKNDTNPVLRKWQLIKINMHQDLLNTDKFLSSYKSH